MKNKVYNWQIKRKMEYKYPEARPQKQAAWVFDTNKCIACQTCTLACKNAWTSGKGQESMWWNNVETKPFGFYPLGYDVRLLEMLGPQKWDGDKYIGKTIFEAAPYGEEMLGWMPEEEDWAYPNMGEDEVNKQIPEKANFTLPHLSWMFYLQRICNHCTYPACLAACPRKSIYKRKEDGIVLLDQERCRGYQECVAGCPYKKSMFRAFTGKSEKCISCYPAAENDYQTQCVINCIGRIRLFGFKSNYDKPIENNPIDYFVHIKKIALPLYPQFGTEPNVYYIPPIHVPKEYTRQLFGPGADAAVELYKKAKEDKNLVGLLMLFGATDKIIHSFKVEGDMLDGHCIGYDGEGKEIVRVPLKEHVIIRKEYDEKQDVYRASVT
ncbi:MAG: dehydrogenase [Omnitrophica bacterium GWA2_41_15]|nr:MAG: dehydrogenase [Omnitrophica bacterium GWA2_41_15]HAZ10686.1 dehydrogenase [Candidatus Omnitrophota bacterium]